MPRSGRRAFLMGASALVAAAPAVAESGVVLNFDGADPTWDLAPDNPAIWLLQQAGMALRDAMLSSRFEEEFAALKGEIDRAIGNRLVGYLVRVEVYADGAGAVVIPNGRLVYPVRAGREPVDALAEHIRTPQIRATRPNGLRDMSTYVWLRRVGGEIKGSAMPASGRAKFEQSALAIARQRHLLAEGGAEADGRRRVQRAAFWAEVARTHLQDIRREDRRRAIEALNDRFRKAEAEFNRAYEAYGELEREMARRAEYLAVLDKVEAVAGVLKLAAERGYLDALGKAVSTPAAPETGSTAAEKAAQADRMAQLKDLMLQSVPEVDARGKRLKDIEIELRATYESETTIPSAPPVAVPQVP